MNTNLEQSGLHKNGSGTDKAPIRFASRVWLQRIALGLSFITVFLLFAFPILKLIALSFVHKTGTGLGVYFDLLNEARTWKTVESTLIIISGSTLVSLILGIGIAWLIAYSNLSHKVWLHLIVMLSFIIPSYVVTLAWTSFTGVQGPIADFLHLFSSELKPWSMYSYGGIIWVMGIHHYPLVYLLTVGVLRRIPRELEWASRSGGAGKWTTFRTITLPLAMPGIASGGLLAFLASLDNFGIPAFLGIPANITVLSTLIYEQVVGFGPSAFARSSALAVLLGVIAVIGTWIQWLVQRSYRSSETSYEDMKPRFQLGKRKWLWTGIVWLFLAVITFLPLVSMLMYSLKKAYGLPFGWDNTTADHYRFVLWENTKAHHAIGNSFILSFVTLIVCLILGTAFAYYRLRRPTLLVKSMDLVISLPYALPGIVFGLAMIFTWMEPIPGWNPGVYGSMAILFIAYVIRFMTLQVRSSITAFLQVDASSVEAARISGAGWSSVWRKILFPLTIPGVLAGALLVFLSALTELTVSSLLWSSGSETIGVVIFNFEQAGSTNYSTALSCVIVALIMVFMFLLQAVNNWTARRKGGVL
ncbi:iron(III) transport system permease protein [Paenibacillus sp. 1_12]|uniref:ABC transporter permease n=1 Tax=Paenibacillus sp. 1_12 TaxID=1566278 RepID=UPI0008EA0C94|nr:iron ABC transporter permease [Paenibacillus sp. 1_12]SFK95915.1 iron(III) transport system permease protein [Paenibacillus sp. 1_12]